jgi:60 kDa SS-A/Ro ribonucleoprotein
VVGQRTVTHLGSTVLAKHLSGTDLGRRFFSKRSRKGNVGGIIYRLDDMLEIVACYMALNPDKPLPNSMKKGFKAALEVADTYELAKYQSKGKGVSLVDVVNLVHPKPSAEMVETFSILSKIKIQKWVR